MEPKTEKTQRFVLMATPPEGEESDDRTLWWFDTNRPLDDPKQPYMAVQTYADKNANDYVQIDNLTLVFQDPLEYYAVCRDCYFTYSDTQWCGNSRGAHGWRERAEKWLEKYQREKGWCQFCDPVFGGGGWRL